MSLLWVKGGTWANTGETIPWDPSLLPLEVAPSIVRVAILHPGVLEEFLPKFFVRSSDLWVDKSTFQRSDLILHRVKDFGWSAAKHTAGLLDLEAIKRREDGSEVETVKKFIRDLRRRYSNYLEHLKARREAKGDSQQRKRAAHVP